MDSKDWDDRFEAAQARGPRPAKLTRNRDAVAARRRPLCGGSSEQWAKPAWRIVIGLLAAGYYFVAKDGSWARSPWGATLCFAYAAWSIASGMLYLKRLLSYKRNQSFTVDLHRQYSVALNPIGLSQLQHLFCLVGSPSPIPTSRDMSNSFRFR